MAFVKGDRYKHYTSITGKGRKSRKPVVRECVVIQECERFVTVDFGNYRESISKASMFIREEWMEKVV